MSLKHNLKLLVWLACVKTLLVFRIKKKRNKRKIKIRRNFIQSKKKKNYIQNHVCTQMTGKLYTYKAKKKTIIIYIYILNICQALQCSAGGSELAATKEIKRKKKKLAAETKSARQNFDRSSMQKNHHSLDSKTKHVFLHIVLPMCGGTELRSRLRLLKNKA